MAKFFRKDARMTTAVAPLLSVSPRVQLTARQRACLEQIARRQTSPQRLVRRAKILLALETGATQCHVMRQMHLNRGTVQMWCRRWCALAPKLEQMEADGGSDKAPHHGDRGGLDRSPTPGHARHLYGGTDCPDCRRGV